MAKQSELDRAYLNMCFEWSKLSKAKRMKVGCLVVKDHQIISDGFNGMPSGFGNCCEFQDVVYYPPHISYPKRYEVGDTLPEVLHAEANAITKLSKSTNSSNGATLYCTLSPCLECSKLIVQAGINRVVFAKLYETVPFGPIKEFLRAAGVAIVNLGEGDEIQV